MLLRASRTVGSLLVALAVTACGGGGGGGGSDDGGPATGGGSNGGGSGNGSAAVARVDQVTVPGYDWLNDTLLVVGASNNGLYLSVTTPVGDSTILKLHGNPIHDDWSSASPGGLITSEAIANIYSEADGAFGFYYVRTDAALEDFWGLYTANTGAPGFEVKDNAAIQQVAAGGREGIAGSRPWAIALGTFPSGLPRYNADYRYVYQDDGAYTASRLSADYFTTPAEEVALPNGADAMLAHPSDGTLFVAYGSELRIYSGNARLRTEALPAGGTLFDSVTDMMWVDDALWFSYGSRFYKRTGPSAFELVAELGSASAAPLSGRFCMKHGEVFGADGRATRVSDGRIRDYIAKGSLSASQQVDASVLRASLSSGVYCSAYGAAEAGGVVTLYALGSAPNQDKVRMITTVGD